MKTKHIFWGILFISIGMLWLLDRFIWLSVEWNYVWKLWPVVIILWGVSLMVTNHLIRGIITAITAFLLALALFTSVKYGVIHTGDGIEWNINDDGISDKFEVTDYSESYNDNYQKATLHFEAGAGSFIAHDTTEELFHANVEGRKDSYNLTKSGTGNDVNLNFDMHKKHINFFPFNKMRNRVDLKLNSTPLWDLNFNLGAASIDFDLTPYKTYNIAIKMGAASLKLKLGDRSEESRLNIDAGASSIDIDVPQDAGCEVKTESSLSAKYINGFKNIEDNLYRTDNFDSAKKKIYITIKSGVSSITINRYSIPSV
jgi:hypothetical protein